MAGLADLLYLGQPDPRRQLAAMLSGQQPQGAPPPGPAPPGTNPPPPGGAAADPNAPAPAAQPVSATGSSVTQNPAPGAPPPPGSPPEPQALQSTPDMAASYQTLANPPNLMNLYLQLDARQRASDQINKGFALIAANHAGNPGMARAIMDSVSGGADAGGTVNNLMSLYQAQQQMAGQQQMLAQAPALAAKLGLDEGTVRSMILAGRGSDLVQDLKPTDMQRNYAWARDTYAKNHPGASQDDIDEGAQSILLGMGGMGGGDADTKSWRAAKIQWDQNPATKGTPYPWGTGADDNPTRFRAWSGAQVEADKQQSADQAEASKMGPGYRGNLQGERDKLQNILQLDADGNMAPARKAQLQRLLGNDQAQKWINAEPTKGSGTWDQDFAAWWGNLNPDDQTLLTQIRDATNPNIRLGTQSKPVPKRGVSNVSEIATGLDGMRNATQGYDDWLTGAKGTLRAIDGSIINSFGAQGTPEQAEDYVRKHNLPPEAMTLMDDDYLSGGSMYPKGRGLTTMTPQQVNAATAAIKGAGDPEAERQRQIKLALIRNTDPGPLKNMKT